MTIAEMNKSAHPHRRAEHGRPEQGDPPGLLRPCRSGRRFAPEGVLDAAVVGLDKGGIADPGQEQSDKHMGHGDEVEPADYSLPSGFHCLLFLYQEKYQVKIF